MKKKTSSPRTNPNTKTAKVERSFGIIVWCCDDNGIVRYLMVMPQGREEYSFPKGHAESRQLPEDAMLRELYEETGLRDVTLDPDVFFTELYTVSHGKKTIKKVVRYAIARVDCVPSVHSGDDEIQKVQWLTAEEMLAHNTFPSRRMLLADVESYVASRRMRL